MAISPLLPHSSTAFIVCYNQTDIRNYVFEELKNWLNSMRISLDQKNKILENTRTGYVSLNNNKYVIINGGDNIAIKASRPNI